MAATAEQAASIAEAPARRAVAPASSAEWSAKRYRAS
jgi:hypothetical protein